MNSIEANSEVNLNIKQTNIRNYINRLLPDCKDTPFFVYIHGSAGTGKTTLLNVLRDDVNKFFQSKEACLVTAPTGSAARDVKGKTLHQTFGISIDEAHAFQLLKPAIYKILRAMLGKTKVLFIDEISLVSALLFAQTSANIQMALGSQKPFGGLSIILFGDLLQLSPVNGNPIYEEVPQQFSTARRSRAPCDTYRLWDLFKMFRLFENVRTDDESEAKMLMEVREERISEETEKFFKRHFVIRNSTDAGIFDEVELLRRLYPEKEIAILAARNTVVNRMNEIKINRMEGVQQIRWTSVKKGSESTKAFKEVEYFPRKLTLAPGCRVILTANRKKEEGLVNGTIGILQEIREDHVIVKFSEHSRVRIDPTGFKKKTATEEGELFWKQLPIREAEVITIHNSQGKTFDGVVVLASGLFTPGLMYTALSRARSLQLCKVTPLKMEQWKQSNKAKEAYLEKTKRRNN